VDEVIVLMNVLGPMNMLKDQPPPSMDEVIDLALSPYPVMVRVINLEVNLNLEMIIHF
jgi:hypothetical protein